MSWIRDYYGVPAYRGRRIRFTGYSEPIEGRIISARHGKLYIRRDDGKLILDGDGERMGPFHPVWEIEYL